MQKIIIVNSRQHEEKHAGWETSTIILHNQKS